MSEHCERHTHHASDCGCKNGGCAHSGHFKRHFETKAEEIQRLEAYLADLRAEIQGVEEYLGELKK